MHTDTLSTPTATPVGSVDHVGVLTDDLEAVCLLAAQLGLAISPVERHDELGVEVVWIELAGLRVEVIHPTDPSGRAAKAAAAGRLGVDHIALAVEDCARALDDLAAAGVALADVVPRAGVHGSRVGFLDARGAGGLRVELVEPVRG